MYDDEQESTRLSPEEAAAALAAEDAGFAEEAVIPAEDDPEPAPKPAQTAAEPAPPAPVTSPSPPAAPTPPVEITDPYAGLPPEVRDALAEIPTLRHQIESDKGRVAGLNRTLDETKAKLEKATTAASPPPPAPRNEQLERVRGELPEVADAIESVIKDAIKAATPPPAPPAPTQQAAPSPQSSSTTPNDPEMELLNREHAGWGEKVASTDFKLWLSRQPDAYQAEVWGTHRSGVLITALTKFEKFQEQATSASQVAAKRSGRVAAAVTHASAARPSASRASEPQTEEDAFAAEASRPRR